MSCRLFKFGLSAAEISVAWWGGLQVMVVTPTRELAVQVAGEIVALQGHTNDVALLLDPTTVRRCAELLARCADG